MTSLQYLYDLTQCVENIILFKENNIDYFAVFEYYSATNEYYSKNYYFLGGDIRLELNEPITDEHIQFIQDKNKTMDTYNFANSFEYGSCIEHKRKFDNFVKVWEFIKNNDQLIHA